MLLKDFAYTYMTSKAFQDFVVRFSSEKVHVKVYITMKIIFGDEENIRLIMVRYFIINAPYLYTIIGKVMVIQGDQEFTKKCYMENMKLKKSIIVMTHAHQPEVH